MAGYRQHSFDPNAYERQGPPLRPFNWVQWTGVGLGVLAIAIDLVYFAGRFGWIRPLLNSPIASNGFLVGAVVLINSRRQTLTDLAPELAAQRHRWLLITVAICAVILGAAAIIDLKGA